MSGIGSPVSLEREEDDSRDTILMTEVMHRFDISMTSRLETDARKAQRRRNRNRETTREEALQRDAISASFHEGWTRIQADMKRTFRLLADTHRNCTSSHYARLSVSKTATLEEIKAAFKKLALDLHPDKQINDALVQRRAQERFTAVREAFEVLKDPLSRSRYDM